MLDAFWLRPDMAITINMQPESGRILYAGSDFLHLIRFRSAKEGSTMTCKNRPGSYFVGLVRFLPDTSDLKVIQCTRINGTGCGKTHPARYQFQIFRLGCVLPQTAQIISCKTSPGSDLILVDCVRLWPNGSCRKQTSVHESSGPLLANVSKPTRNGCESDPACLLGYPNFLRERKAEGRNRTNVCLLTYHSLTPNR